MASDPTNIILQVMEAWYREENEALHLERRNLEVSIQLLQSQMRDLEARNLRINTIYNMALTRIDNADRRMDEYESIIHDIFLREPAYRWEYQERIVFEDLPMMTEAEMDALLNEETETEMSEEELSEGLL